MPTEPQQQTCVCLMLGPKYISMAPKTNAIKRLSQECEAAKKSPYSMTA